MDQNHTSGTIEDAAAQTPGTPTPGMSDLVMAWARHADTGRLLYILELTLDQRGEACGCVCIACKEPVIAVNAAKAKFVRRPHFRHRPGVHADSCMVLASRELLRASLVPGDLIQLPKLARSTNFVGLSGAEYTAWIEVPSETVRIGRVDFHDGLVATLLLDDGRTLEVQLVGTGDQAAGDDTLTPRIRITLDDDPSVAGMSADDIRRRLKPVIAGAVWCKHWNDEQFASAALELAQQKATDALDWIEEDEDLPPGPRRESLLHREVKTILEQARHLAVPPWRQGQPGTVMLQLAGAVLEKRLGRIIPDVVAKLTDGSEMLVEVTVTNAIKDERRERIKAVGLPTLEIDLSQMGGRLTKQQLTEIVTVHIAGKRWVFHPAADLHLASSSPPQQVTLQLSLAAVNYINLIIARAEANKRLPGTSPEHHNDRLSDVANQLGAAAAKLASSGYPAALGAEIMGTEPPTFLDRILSIKLDRGVGYHRDAAWPVIKSILQDVEHTPRKWHVVYLMAIHAYKPRLTADQEGRVKDWRTRVVTSVQQGEPTYLRTTRYDELLALILPEMADQLASAFARPRATLTVKPTAKIKGILDLGPEYYDGAMEQRWMWTTKVRTVTQHALSRVGGNEMSPEEKLISASLTTFRAGDPWAFALALQRSRNVSKGTTLRFLHQQGYTEAF